MADEPDRDGPPCRLFALPAELRNRIYRMTVVKPTGPRIHITAAGHERPALLNTCKQVRTEALKIFYYENIFHWEIRDFDADFLVTWREVLEALKLKRKNMNMRCIVDIQVRSWPNLSRWLKAHHSLDSFPCWERPAWLLARGGHVEGEEYLVSNFFRITCRLKQQPWVVVEQILEDMRPSLIAVNCLWADD